MLPFKIIRKIGKMLRGGAGSREIFLGTLCGVLIGFNPVAGLTLGLMILITLLLNANIGFAMLGVALGKILSLLISVVTFHTGFFLIHKVGLEGLFAKLANAPVTALMDLDVYAMIGSLPFSIIIGLLFGKFMAGTVTKVREQMVKAGEHEKVGKAVGNRFSRFLMWLAFGKQKISTADVLAKESTLVRKSGIILVAVVLVIGLLLEFLLVDSLLKKGLETAISSGTGAEVNVEDAHFSMGSGKLEVVNLQVTDPDKPTHNLVQIEQLSADLSVSDLLRRTYTVDRLAGSVLKTDVERASPGKVFEKVKDEADAAEEEKPDAEDGKSLDDYLAQAAKYKEYGRKIQDYLEKRQENAEAEAKGEKPEPSKDRALADAKRVGYLKARADLVTDRPEWTIRSLEIDQVEFSDSYPAHKIEGSELSSHPELNGVPTSIAMIPMDSEEPALKTVLHFEDPAAPHEISASFKNVDLAKAVKTGDDLKLEKGLADISAGGTFSSKTLDVPFTLTVRELKTNNDIVNNLKNIDVPGRLYGSLALPKVKVELDDNLKDAALDAAKAKAKEEVKKEAAKQLDKALDSDEAKDLKDKFKKLF
ncbi:hypothetical protein [Pontiella agarivorans]|uniref:TIGR03546 family protein n=1 Tax=Pontiella agarivorans TaxID=3038953 RepID=A0ABU5MWW4_9BACT|nr:hypothetical protein [Pontiella agarivorans]MDZ8118683.1 hypothetical protein [Pontiella agarivorans]